MKIIGGKLFKSNIKDLFSYTNQYLYISSYSMEVTSFEIFEFIQLIERNVKIEIITNKSIPIETLRKLEKLYGISIFQNEEVHSKIYVNENRAILGSCNFGNLNIQRFYECGILFKKYEFSKEHQFLINEFSNLKSLSKVLMPCLPSEMKKSLDLRDFI
ncbi:MAG: phospholipase D-like domain-containing protein [Chryseotalea sp.]|nr:phospholipase D-like domain-containing protein [Cytophagales bacterium]